jgi:serine/threonine-protein kinase
VFAAANATAMALKHLQLVPAVPSSRTELPIPADLEVVIMQCLAKDPADRPATVRDVAAALDAGDVPSWTPDDAAGWWQRHLPAMSSRRQPQDGPGLASATERQAAHA